MTSRSEARRLAVQTEAPRERWTITERPQHSDVLMQRPDGPTVTVRHSGDSAAALDLARRIARLEALEAVAEAMRCMRRAYNSERGYGRSLHAAFIALDALDATGGDDG